MFCPNCGNGLHDSARFCSACGTAASRPAGPGGVPDGRPASAGPPTAGGQPAPRTSIDFRRLGTGDLIAGGSTVLVFISLFLPWYRVTIQGLSISALDAAAGGWRYLDLLVSLIIIGYIFMRTMQPRGIRLPLPHWQLLSVLSVVNGILVTFTFFLRPAGFNDPVSPGFGAFVGLLTAAAAIAGSISRQRQPEVIDVGATNRPTVPAAPWPDGPPASPAMRPGWSSNGSAPIPSGVASDSIGSARDFFASARPAAHPSDALTGSPSWDDDRAIAAPPPRRDAGAPRPLVHPSPAADPPRPPDAPTALAPTIAENPSFPQPTGAPTQMWSPDREHPVGPAPHPAPDTPVFCTSCGAGVPPENRFCNACGDPVV